MNEQEREDQRIECLNKAIGKKNCLETLIRNLEKDYKEACESVEIWS